jgi:hypothetical protein
MLGADGTKALAPSRVQRLSARTSSRTPLRRGQVATPLVHVLAVKSHPTPRIRLGRRGAGTVVHKAIEHLSLPYDPASRRLFGVPVVVTNSQTAGVGHAVAIDAVGLDSDTQGISVTWSETSNDDDWSKNLIRARCEGRFATSVYSPLGVVSADLTA